MTIRTIDDPRPSPSAGPGCLQDSKRRIFPLRSVAFKATAIDRIAEVVLEQTFANPFGEALEATYIFPLPSEGAVTRFELQAGEHRIVGKVQERQEARRTYEAAVEAGKQAALLEQDRSSVFTMSVGNIPPCESVTVRLAWSERLPAFDTGETELRIPLVVAPRYMPGEALERPSVGNGVESDTTKVPDASRISPPRLAPGLRGDVALSIDVELVGEVCDLACTQHAMKISVGRFLRVSLANQACPERDPSRGTSEGSSRRAELLDRDFVLRWRPAGERERIRAFVKPEGNRVFGMLALTPPREAPLPVAREIVFLVDRSGSMAGAKLEGAKTALARLVGELVEGDRFAIALFSDGVEWLAKPEDATATQIAGARSRIARVGAHGGTQLARAVEEAFRAFKGDAGHRIRALVIITDGEVGNEDELLRVVGEGCAKTGARVFALGIDTAVNEGFVKKLAGIGRGTASLCHPGDELTRTTSRIAQELRTPVLLDVSVEDGDLGLEAVTPSPLPDLFAGRTASVFFVAKKSQGKIRVKARRPGEPAFVEEVEVEPVETGALRSLWARSRAQDLEDKIRSLRSGPWWASARAELVRHGLEFQVLTSLTSFVAILETKETPCAASGTDAARGGPEARVAVVPIDDRETTLEKPLPRRSVVQPVEMPAQWAGDPADLQVVAQGGMGILYRSKSTGAYLKSTANGIVEVPPEPTGPSAWREHATQMRSDFKLTADGAMIGNPVPPNHGSLFPGYDSKTTKKRLTSTGGGTLEAEKSVEKPVEKKKKTGLLGWVAGLLGGSDAEDAAFHRGFAPKPAVPVRGFEWRNPYEIFRTTFELDLDECVGRFRRLLEEAIVALVAGSWPEDGGAPLELARVHTLLASQKGLLTGNQKKFPTLPTPVLELLERDGFELLGKLARKDGAPADHVAAAKALLEKLVASLATV